MKLRFEVLHVVLHLTIVGCCCVVYFVSLTDEYAATQASDQFLYILKWFLNKASEPPVIYSVNEAKM